jgi:hypothetical protein
MWKDILKKERDVFPNIDAIRVEYDNKVNTIINMLKNMKKEVNYENIKDELIMPKRPIVYGTHQEEFTQEEMDEIINSKIKSYNKVNEIISENRPLDIPSLAAFEINQVGRGLGGGYTRLLSFVPEELKDEFHRQFHWRKPNFSAKQLKDWINEHRK